MVEREPSGADRGGGPLLSRTMVGRETMTRSPSNPPAGHRAPGGPSTWSCGVRPGLVLTSGPPRQLPWVAIVVGSVIFSIDQGAVLRHEAAAITYHGRALTYLVPFCLSICGILVATRRTKGRS